MKSDKVQNGPIGVITEQGDLGLGYTPLTESDHKAYENRPNNNDKKDKEKK